MAHSILEVLGRKSAVSPGYNRFFPLISEATLEAARRRDNRRGEHSSVCGISELVHWLWCAVVANGRVRGVSSSQKRIC